MKFSITLDEARWVRVHNNNKKKLKEFRAVSARALARYIVKRAKNNLSSEHLHDDSLGRLRRSIRMTETTLGAMVKVDARSEKNEPYAMYVERGTGIYALGGMGRKTPWFYKHRKLGEIRTWGQRPKEFMRLAVDDAKAKKNRILGGVWKRGI